MAIERFANFREDYLSYYACYELLLKFFPISNNPCQMLNVKIQ